MEQWQVFLMFSVNLITIIVGVGKGLTVLISVRDDIRDLKVNVGARQPPTGLMGDVHDLKREFRTNRDSLIEITAELGLPRPGGRS